MSTRSVRATTFAFVDVETTGIDPRQDRIVEIACQVVRGQTTLETFHSLVDPRRSIPATASAIHHITDDDVAMQPTLAALEPEIRRLCAGAVIVAHNARFDVGFLPFLQYHPILCSMRFAMHVIPDAPNFKNQVLRYYLKANDRSLIGAPAHRAAGDVAVTRRNFAICLERYFSAGGADDIDALLQVIAAPRRIRTLYFGRHRGQAIADVPYDYLQWLTTAAAISDDVRFSASQELARRQSVA